VLRDRLLSALVLIPIVGMASYLGGPVFLGVVLISGLRAAFEFVRMAWRKAMPASYLFVGLLVSSFVLDAQWPDQILIQWAPTFLPLAALTFEVFRGNAPGSLRNWSLIVSGGIYIGLLSYAVRLRALDGGFRWLLLALGSTWVCDTAAYCVGSMWGKHSFFPRISPSKTWEGTIAGIVFGVGSVAFLGHSLLDLGWPWGFLLGILVVLGAIFGDLAESVIKRQLGAKDSGRLIPGHGGVLDRMDSLLFVMPIVYYFVTSFSHVGL